MFERATVFAALFALIGFGILGLKYLNFMGSQSSATPITVTKYRETKTQGVVQIRISKK